jgi:glycosyltransferase involved in cell wall biosynthesis
LFGQRLVRLYIFYGYGEHKGDNGLRVLMLSKACVVGIYQRKLEEMAKCGITLKVVVPPKWAEASGDVPLERAYTNGYDLQVAPIRFNGNFHLHYYPTFGRLAQEFQPDIIHIDEEPYNLATWLAARTARHLKAKPLFFTWQNIARPYPPPFSWGQTWAFRHCQYAIAGTQDAADVLKAKGYQGKVAVIPQFGIAPDDFKPVAPKQPASGAFVIGYIGRLVAEKGIDLLVEALAQLPYLGITQPTEVHVYGQGPQQESLAAQAAKLGVTLHFKGQAPSLEMPKIYPTLDALVLPSRTMANWKEQFGRVLIEAMACGIPVIGAESGAIPGVIGQAGLTFPEGNMAALAGALRRLMLDGQLSAALAQAGRQRILDHFTHASVAKQTVVLYQKMMQR